MYITEFEVLQEKLAEDGKVIEYFIQRHENSLQRKKMEEGEKYYCCQHDVLQKNFAEKPFAETEYQQDGKEEERIRRFQNPNRSNHHTVSPFHHILVEQKAAYLVGREPSILVGNDTEGYSSFLARKADETFQTIVYQWIVGAANKGVEYVHLYYDKKGSLQYTIVPAEQVIVFYDNVDSREIAQVIRYYDTLHLEKGKETLRRKVEVWTQEDVTYYKEDSRGNIVLEELEQNPRGHWTIVEEASGKRQEYGWGKVPFLPLRNNNKEMTDLELIKGLIDAYDLICSEGTNNLIDLVDLYWVIAGYGGETAGAIAKKLQINRAVHISDAGGKVEAKQVTLPVEGRIQWLKLLRKDIFHFGMGVDTDSENLGNAPSGVSLKFQYAMFQLKINSILPELKRALKQLFQFLTEDNNRQQKTKYDWREIEIQLNTSGITDELELVNMIVASKGMVSEKTLLGQHPFVKDSNSEWEALQQEREEGKEV